MFLSRTWLICRVCMQQTDEMINLFSNVSDLPVWNLLSDCGGIPVHRNDNLPDKICSDCIERLWKAHAFRLDCQRAHREITQRVQPTLNCDEKELLSEHEDDKSSILEKYHTAVIEKFEAQEGNGYEQGSCSSIEIFSTTDSRIPSILNSQRCPSNSDEEEFLTDYTGNRCESPAFNDIKPNYDIDKDVKVAYEDNDDDDINGNGYNDYDWKQDANVPPPIKKRIVSTFQKKANTKLRRPTTQRKRTSRLECTSNSKKSTHVCNICENVYSSAELLRHHKYVHKKPHICNICGRMFSQVQQYKNHMNSHSGLQPYHCRFCPRGFADTSNRNKHEKNVHNRKTIRKVPQSRECLVCNKTFSTLSCLREHHRNEHSMTNTNEEIGGEEPTDTSTLV